MKSYKVCLCGRANVGKSTLFNRLIGQRKSLVFNEPGVTRDFVLAQANWDGVSLELADLAGLEVGASAHKINTSQELRALASQAALSYLNSSDLVLFVLDGRAPLTAADKDLANLVRASGRKILLVIAKVEGVEGTVEQSAQAEASQLGFGAGVVTSAEHNLGIFELKSKILEALPACKTSLPSSEIPEQNLDDLNNTIYIGVYGRPNVGKSTLVNQLIGRDRMITSPIPGTTVDIIDSEFWVNHRRYCVLDTAGIRRKSKTKDGVEVLSVVQSLKSLSRVDVAIFMLDGFEGVTDQDEKIAGKILESGKPVIIFINKWDLCHVKQELYAKRLRDELGFLDYAPLVFASAQNGQGLVPLWELIDEMLKQRSFVAPTSQLNRLLNSISGLNNPKAVKLFYASQTRCHPPTITCIVNNPKKIHFAYERFLKNKLRLSFGWMGSPLKLVFKPRKKLSNRNPATKMSC